MKRSTLAFKWLLCILMFVLIVAISLYYKNRDHSIIILSQDPSIHLYENFISDNEAKHLISLAKGRLYASTIGDNKKTHMRNFMRRSSTANLFNDDDITTGIKEKVCCLVGCQTNQIEALQVVHYSKGEYFAPHIDSFPPEIIIKAGGQRIHTFFVYLNDVSEKDGGKTVFPVLGLEVQPKQRTALYFKNTNEAGEINNFTLHAGSMIRTEGVEKWACNIWVRDRPIPTFQP